MIDPKLIAVRDSLPGDRAFILATWLRGLYYGETYYSDIPKDVFMKHYHDILEARMAQSVIKVSCLRDDPEVILGYSVYHDSAGAGVLDFIFVKKAWRKNGIAHSLLPPNFRFCSHLTKLGKSIKPADITFNPFV